MVGVFMMEGRTLLARCRIILRFHQEGLQPPQMSLDADDLHCMAAWQSCIHLLQSSGDRNCPLLFIFSSLLLLYLQGSGPGQLCSWPCCAFLESELLVTGQSLGMLRIWNVSNPSQVRIIVCCLPQCRLGNAQPQTCFSVYVSCCSGSYNEAVCNVNNSAGHIRFCIADATLQPSGVIPCSTRLASTL